MKFQADNIEYWSHSGVETVFFGNEEKHLALTLSKTLASDEHYLEWNEQSNACYNGVRKIQLSGDSVHLELLPDAAEQLGQTEFVIEFNCDEAVFAELSRRLALIFQEKLLLKKTTARPKTSPPKDYSSIRYLNLEGKNLKQLPAYVREMAALETAKLAYNPDLDLQDTFELLANCPNLRELSFTTTGGAIPENLGQLGQLETLSISGLTQACSLPESIGQLKQLKSLLVMSDADLVLPEAFAGLTALRELNLRIEGTWNLPTRFFQLSNLRQLDFTNCRIDYFPPEMAQMAAVETVIFGGPQAADFSKIMPIVAQMPKVKCLEMNRNPVPPEIGLCKNIEELILWTGSSPENPLELPDELFELSQIQTLLLSLNYFNNIPEGIGRLKALKTLVLKECDVAQLPDSLGELSNLEYLNLSENPSLRALPESLGKLTQLKELHFEDTPQLTELPLSLNNLTNLQTLRLSHPENIKNIPEAWSALLQCA